NTAFADKSAPTKVAARQRYVEDVVAPPTKTASVQQEKLHLFSKLSGSIKISLPFSPALPSTVQQATTTPTA
ncbi:hypothetical protein, partial [Pseudomonas viridiflava]|uniref:hypothetical protein n=1 Tax=Pseudomonas viridiflava TaxID=33069 RepID=UPI00197E204A